MPRTPDGGWLLDDSEITKFEPPKKKKEKKKIKKQRSKGKRKAECVKFYTWIRLRILA
ncbi:hypothetical protein LCGC14_0802520 [marine sediment metagenome]|uniref:Uncharacterized protein n=1 Tax=marine sediment metagenome TaxID=412755 RepID=A0A0F9PTS6_9ZZZZ